MELNILRDKVIGKMLKQTGLGNSVVFNDQLLSSAEQIYRIASGKYRFFADLRPIIANTFCTHPYDLGGILVAQEAGVIVMDPQGKSGIKYPLDTETNCGFVAYANESIRQCVEPILLEEIAKLA